jgi:hypothetical protein
MGWLGLGIFTNLPGFSPPAVVFAALRPSFRSAMHQSRLAQFGILVVSLLFLGLQALAG